MSNQLILPSRAELIAPHTEHGTAFPPNFVVQHTGSPSITACPWLYITFNLNDSDDQITIARIIWNMMLYGAYNYKTCRR